MVTCCDLSAFLHEFVVYSIDSPKTIGNFPEALNLNRLSSKSTGLSVTSTGSPGSLVAIM